MNGKDIFVPHRLREFFSQHRRIALAFSGGCDSAYLLYAAAACGAYVKAYYVHSQFQPAFELDDARRLARELKADMRVLELDVLADAQVKENPADRCYFCKQRIFGKILEAAQEDGFACVMDGTNASDDASDRPGMRALEEMQVLSPLRLCGIDKAQVRDLSQKAGLFTWNKPAYACLATRIPTGMEIAAQLLEKIERAEGLLSKLDFENFRVRLNDREARIEVPESQMALVLKRRRDILAAMEADFDEITLDLRPRREVEA